jgi:hypothetical protein
MKICDSSVSCRSLSQKWTKGTSFPICTALYNSNWTMCVMDIGRKIDVRKWCPVTILGWWQRSNSGNVGPIWEHISSDSANNSSNFYSDHFCLWKDMHRARNAFRWAFGTISQFTTHRGHVVWSSKDVNRLSHQSSVGKVADRDFSSQFLSRKTPLALISRFNSSGIPAMHVVVLLIVDRWYGSDSRRGIWKHARKTKCLNSRILREISLKSRR